MKRVKKITIIDTCWDCDHRKRINFQTICSKVDKFIPDSFIDDKSLPIPEWCPLGDAE